MPRFVILEHDHPVLHWDFMLEIGAVLRTWRLNQAPSAGSVVSATPLGDHRIAYLTYEGPVSRNRGTVKQWDAGDYEMLEHAQQNLKVLLRGNRLTVTATLELSANSLHWRFDYL